MANIVNKIKAVPGRLEKIGLIKNNSSVIFLDEILIIYSDLSKPHFSRISDIITHNSASASKLFVPTKSASNCKNSLNLPGPGFSFLQTVPSWYLLKGFGISR
mgnify:CR=1 FL=1